MRATTSVRTAAVPQAPWRRARFAGATAAAVSVVSASPRSSVTSTRSPCVDRAARCLSVVRTGYPSRNSVSDMATASARGWLRHHRFEVATTVPPEPHQRPRSTLDDIEPAQQNVSRPVPEPIDQAWWASGQSRRLLRSGQVTSTTGLAGDIYVPASAIANGQLRSIDPAHRPRPNRRCVAASVRGCRCARSVAAPPLARRAACSGRHGESR